MSSRISQWIGLIVVAATMPLLQTVAVAESQIEAAQTARTTTIPHKADNYYIAKTQKLRDLSNCQGRLANHAPQYIEIDPNDDGETYDRRSSMKRENKDYQGALGDINRAIQLNPNNAYFYAGRGSLKYMDLKDRSGGIKDWQRSATMSRQQGDTVLYKLMLDVIKEYKNY